MTEKTLAECLKDVRKQMGPDDVAAICRDGSPAVCESDCPGPGQEGSKCLTLRGDDPRDDAEISAEIEAWVGERH